MPRRKPKKIPGGKKPNRSAAAAAAASNIYIMGRLASPTDAGQADWKNLRTHFLGKRNPAEILKILQSSDSVSDTLNYKPSKDETIAMKCFDLIFDSNLNEAEVMALCEFVLEKKHGASLLIPDAKGRYLLQRFYAHKEPVGPESVFDLAGVCFAEPQTFKDLRHLIVHSSYNQVEALTPLHDVGFISCFSLYVRSYDTETGTIVYKDLSGGKEDVPILVDKELQLFVHMPPEHLEDKLSEWVFEQVLTQLDSTIAPLMEITKALGGNVVPTGGATPVLNFCFDQLRAANHAGFKQVLESDSMTLVVPCKPFDKEGELVYLSQDPEETLRLAGLLCQYSETLLEEKEVEKAERVEAKKAVNNFDSMLTLFKAEEGGGAAAFKDKIAVPSRRP